MWALVVVMIEVGVEDFLHLCERLVPLGSAGGPEVLIKQGAEHALDEAIALRAAHLGGAMLDFLRLQEELIGVPVGPSAELPAVVAQYALDAVDLRLEEGLQVVVEHMHGGQRQLRGVQPAPDMAAEAVDE